MAARRKTGRSVRSRPAVRRFTPLLAEALEPRELLYYTSLENTPLVVGYPKLTGGMIFAGPSHGGAVMNTAGGFIYTPATNFTGVDSLEILVPNGQYTFTLYVVPAVGGPPSDTDRALTVVDDTYRYFQSTSYVLSAADFNFGASSVPPSSLLGIKIDTLPTPGVLSDYRNLTVYGTAPVTSGQVIPISDITSGDVQFYLPSMYAATSPHPALTFQVAYDAGPAGGGIVLDPTVKTITYNIQTINHAPASNYHTITLAPNTPYTFAATDFSFSDPHDTPPNHFQAVKIVSLPMAGTLTDNGAAVTAGQFVPPADLAAGKLVFAPAAGGSGIPYASFNFQVQDDGGTAYGGADLDSNFAPISFVIGSALNLAPHSSDNSVLTSLNQSYIFRIGDFLFSDGQYPASNFLSVKVTTLPTLGTLTDNNVAVTQGQFIPVADLVAGRLAFTPPPDGSGYPYASFTFQVQDDGGTAVVNGTTGVDLDPTPRKMTINVSSINHPPTGLNRTVILSQNTPYTITLYDFGFFDPSDSPANNMVGVKITTAPTAGTLTDRGSPVVAGQFLTASEVTSGALVYTPPLNPTGSPDSSFTFQVRDDGGTFNGGVDTDPNPKTFLFVLPFPYQPPNGSDTTVTVLEDNSYSFAATDFYLQAPPFNPPPGPYYPPPPNLDKLLAVKITSLPAAGSLMDNGQAVSAGQLVPAVDIAAGKLKFTPSANANGSPLTTFAFQVQDDGGTANSRIDLDPTPNRITINVTPVNDPPIDQDRSLQVMFNTTRLFDPTDFAFRDSNDLAPLNPAGANRFFAVIISAVNVNAPSGVLTYNGGVLTAPVVIPIADIAAGNLAFVAGATLNQQASFGFQLEDDGGTASGGIDTDPTVRTMTLVVGQSLPNAPAGKNGSVSTLEDTPYVFQAADFGFSDPLDNPANHFKAVKISSLPVGGTLSDAGVALAAGQFVPVSDIDNGFFKFIQQVPNANGSPFTMFTFQVQDDGGTANGSVDLDQSPNTITVNVAPVNDPPFGIGSGAFVVQPSMMGGHPQPITIAEDQSYTFSVADFGFSDPNDNPPNAFQSVKITTLPSAGTLLLANTAVTAGQFIPAAIGQLRFLPPANANGPLVTSFTFQVQDNGGTANGGLDLQVTPGTLAFSVISVNDAPSGADKTISLNEDSVYTFAAQDFGFTDPSDSPPNNFLGVRIVSLPTSGILLDNNIPVVVGQFISRLEIDVALLEFLPALNAYGSSYAQFAFQVKDDGGTANVGLDLDPTPNTVAINVTRVNDPPLGNNRTIVVLEDASYTFSAADWAFTDPNDSPADSFLAVKIDTLPALGMLRLNGNPVAANQSILVSSLIAGQLVYTPPANTTGMTSLTFQVQDSGGTANGGSDLDPIPRTLTVRIIPPIGGGNFHGTSGVVNALEDVPYTISASNFGFISFANPPTQLRAVKITTLPSVSALTDNGTPLTPGAFVPVSDIDAGNLKYTAPTNANGAALSMFMFQVQDNGGTADGRIDIDPSPKTLTVNVTSVNDAPRGTTNTVTTFEDTAYTFPLVAFGFTDPSDNPPNSLLAVKIATLPSLGSLLDNGVVVTAGQFISVADIASGNLRYIPLSNAVASPMTSFTFQVQDNGGTANGGVDLDPLPKTMTINVQGNEVITNDDSYTTLEDTPLTVNAPGVLSNDMQYYVGGAPSPLPFSAVPVTNPAHGSLTLHADGGFIYTPAANFNGQDSFTYKAVGEVDGNVATVTLSVTPVNDPPSGLDLTVALPLYATYVFPISDFPLTDGNDNPSNALSAVKIATLPAAGTLTDNGVPVIVGQFVPVADLAGGLMRYTPPVNFVLYDSFTFQVQDNGGTTNGGIDLDPTPNTITLGPIGPPPEGFDAAVTTLEDQPYVFSYFDLFGPIRDPIPNQPFYPLIAVKITTLPAAGVLLDNGVPVVAGQFIPVVDFLPVGNATAGAVTFVPTVDANGSPLTTFKFQVKDSGGTANGREDVDPTPNTITINATPVNDPPSFVKGPDLAATDESGEIALANWATGISPGPPDEATQQIHFIIVGDDNIRLFASSPSIDAAGNVVFTPAKNAQGAATITIALADDGGIANGGVNRSPNQAFQITITKAHPQHNAIDPLDVNGDGYVVAGDPLAIINFLNAYGAQPVNAAIGTLAPYCDVNADGFISPVDALTIIDVLNAHPASAEGEATSPPNVAPITTNQPPADLLLLIALDVASQPQRRR